MYKRNRFEMLSFRFVIYDNVFSGTLIFLANSRFYRLLTSTKSTISKRFLSEIAIYTYCFPFHAVLYTNLRSRTITERTAQ